MSGWAVPVDVRPTQPESMAVMALGQRVKIPTAHRSLDMAATVVIRSDGSLAANACRDSPAAGLPPLSFHVGEAPVAVVQVPRATVSIVACAITVLQPEHLRRVA